MGQKQEAFKLATWNDQMIKLMDIVRTCRFLKFHCALSTLAESTKLVFTYFMFKNE